VRVCVCVRLSCRLAVECSTVEIESIVLYQVGDPLGARCCWQLVLLSVGTSDAVADGVGYFVETMFTTALR
jgi:hypothetical protein